DPQSIIDDMIGGVSADQMIKVVEIADRKNAIKTAIRLARSEDIVLIAGKGHENYQEIKGKRNPFNDAEIARSFLVQ
ncbi:MAG: UDP-N-acetylmuramoyl-L-alanyl-D-glutamate--2,6-diaminopimelate ligase, partial [Saprospiraceae bacterium]|nr:UDP-N-acetylmuramoyl-L-alanyl-D-glutamate--2,6-diaminopimelate ligase [Saprospiraceae bacterium]